MKVLFILSHLRKGGPVDVVYNICKQVLQTTGYRIKVVTLQPEEENSKLEDF